MTETLLFIGGMGCAFTVWIVVDGLCLSRTNPRYDDDKFTGDN